MTSSAPRTARLEALFEKSPDLIAIHDANGVICDVNERMCDELGYTESELVGKQVWDIDPTVEPAEAKSFWDGLSTDSPHRFEGKLERKDGSTFPIEIHLIRVDLDGDDRFVAMDRDITDQREREASLRNQNDRLDRFASVVSHDLRNPLRVVEGRLQLLREDCDSTHIEPMERAIDRMDAQIEDLLRLSRHGEAAMEQEPVNLASVAEMCWDNVATRDATLSVETSRTIQADSDQLQHLFENLMGNAVEHGGDAVAVTIGDLDDGFYIADDGDGIPKEDREKIFDEGYSTASDGTGFGLSIVRQVVKRHDWKITVTESQNGGTRFEINDLQSV